MRLFHFLMRYSPGRLTVSSLAGFVGGISNIALLALFNSVLTVTGYSRSRFLLALVGLCVLLPLTKFVAENVLTRLTQSAIFDLQLELSRQILQMQLSYLEQLGSHRLMAVLTGDISTIANTLLILPILCINIAVIVGGLAYLAWLSWTILLVVLGFLALGITTYQFPVIRASRLLALARRDADRLFSHFRDLTEGTKELKLHSRRGKAFLSHVLLPTAESFRRNNVAGMTIYSAAANWGQMLVFISIGLILFMLCARPDVDKRAMTGYTITLLYLMNPLQVLMNNLPSLARASASLNNVEGMGLELAARGVQEDDSDPVSEANGDWGSLDLVGATHTYYREGKEGHFTLGPIDLTLSPGELVFVVGGNGSGKTTLAKLLTGLYLPESGEIRLKGCVVTDKTRELYRRHFAMVFSDSYIFQNVLGIQSEDLDERVHSYLTELQLADKVQVKNGVFSTTDLSQGQRKRLALLAAYLEDRPIYVFDEWAADQDPFFRKVFYNQLLPELKARGKAVLVITHDDRYYHIADRIIKLEYGKIIWGEAYGLASRPNFCLQTDAETAGD